MAQDPISAITAVQKALRRHSVDGENDTNPTKQSISDPNTSGRKNSTSHLAPIAPATSPLTSRSLPLPLDSALPQTAITNATRPISASPSATFSSRNDSPRSLPRRQPVQQSPSRNDENLVTIPRYFLDVEAFQHQVILSNGGYNDSSTRVPRHLSILHEQSSIRAAEFGFLSATRPGHVLDLPWKIIGCPAPKSDLFRLARRRQYSILFRAARYIPEFLPGFKLMEHVSATVGKAIIERAIQHIFRSGLAPRPPIKTSKKKKTKRTTTQPPESPPTQVDLSQNTRDIAPLCKRKKPDTTPLCLRPIFQNASSTGTSLVLDDEAPSAGFCPSPTLIDLMRPIFSSGARNYESEREDDADGEPKKTGKRSRGKRGKK